VFIRSSPSYFQVPHAFHELLFGEADFPGISFLLKVRQVVAAVDIYGVELEVAEPPCTFGVPPDFAVHHQLGALVFRQFRVGGAFEGGAEDLRSGDAHMLLDKYVNTGILPDFSPLSLQLFNIVCPVKSCLLLFNWGQLRKSPQVPHVFNRRSLYVPQVFGCGNRYHIMPLTLKAYSLHDHQSR
jgi:hypothetical protein